MKDDICNYGMTEIPDWFTAVIKRNTMEEVREPKNGVLSE